MVMTCPVFAGIIRIDYSGAVLMPHIDIIDSNTGR